jgi:hypothetical protein
MLITETRIIPATIFVDCYAVEVSGRSAYFTMSWIIHCGILARNSTHAVAHVAENAIRSLRNLIGLLLAVLLVR